MRTKWSTGTTWISEIGPHRRKQREFAQKEAKETKGWILCASRPLTALSLTTYGFLNRPGKGRAHRTLHAQTGFCRTILQKTLVLIALCFLCFLLFKFSSLASVSRETSTSRALGKASSLTEAKKTDLNRRKQRKRRAGYGVSRPLTAPSLTAYWFLLSPRQRPSPSNVTRANGNLPNDPPKRPGPDCPLFPLLPSVQILFACFCQPRNLNVASLR